MSEVVAAKQCSKCRRTKPLSEFYSKIDRHGRLRYRYAHCRSCHYLLTQGYRRLHPEKSRRYALDYRSARDLCFSSVAEFRVFLATLDMRCAVCGREGKRGRGINDMQIDHDHRSGEIRGVLCGGCNVALGSARDNPAILRGLAEYLEQPPLRTRRSVAA